MTKLKWIEVMNYKTSMKFESKFILNAIKEFYGKSYNKIRSMLTNEKLKPWDYSWFLDQNILSVSIAKYLKTNKDSKMLINNSSGIMLDRIMNDQIWFDTLTSKYNLIDVVHLHQGNYIDKINFSISLFKKIFEQQQFNSINKYIKEFIEIKNQK